MSLVNEMLRDLDARRDRLSVDSALNGLNPVPINNEQPAYAHWLLIPLIAAVVGLLLWLMAAKYLGNSGVPDEFLDSSAHVAEPVIAQAEPAVETVEIEATPQVPVEAPHKDPVPVVTERVTPAPEPKPRQEKIVAPEPKPVITKKPRTLTPAQQSEQLYAEAVNAFKTGNLRRVETLLNEALVLSPDHIRAREQLAITLIMQQRQREAEELLRAGLAIDSTQANMALQLGQLLAQQNRASEAIAYMEPALLNAADNPQFLGTLAGIYQNAGDPEQAINNYQAALSLRPNQGIWWMGLGISLEQTGQYGNAVAAYREALTQQRLRPDLRKYVNERLAVLQPVAETNQ